jgi:hypothetical protein
MLLYFVSNTLIFVIIFLFWHYTGMPLSHGGVVPSSEIDIMDW